MEMMLAMALSYFAPKLVGGKRAPALVAAMMAAYHAFTEAEGAQGA